MHLKERRHEIAKQINRIFTHIAFITHDINTGRVICGIAFPDCYTRVVIVITGDTNIGNTA